MIVHISLHYLLFRGLSLRKAKKEEKS